MKFSDLPCPYCGGDPKKMTPDIAISHVIESIAKALRGESALDASVLDIKGFATETQRHLVNNLAHLPKDDPCYLEVGLYAGATFCAAISNNPTLWAVGFEDFSQPFGVDDIKTQMMRNIAANCGTFGSGGLKSIIHANCFDKRYDDLEPFDLYYYDGEHSLESQAKALPHFIDSMADVFIFMVDDYSWPSVSEGTRWGFEMLSKRIKIEDKWVLSDGKPDGPRWHNDVALFVIRKT